MPHFPIEEKIIVEDSNQLFENIYNKRKIFIVSVLRFFRRKGGRNCTFEEIEDIFQDSLIVLNEKYFLNKGERNYANLQKILYGIMKIKIYNIITKSVFRIPIEKRRHMAFYKEWRKRRTECERLSRSKKIEKYRLMSRERVRRWRQKKRLA